MELNTVSIDLNATGERILRARERMGLSVRDLQAALGLSEPTAIYKWQRGECLPRLDHLVIIAALCGIPLDELICTKKITNWANKNKGEHSRE